MPGGVPGGSTLRCLFLLLEAPKDLIDHPGVGEERDDSHFLAASAQKRIYLVDPADELGPLSAESSSLRRGRHLVIGLY